MLDDSYFVREPANDEFRRTAVDAILGRFGPRFDAARTGMAIVSRAGAWLRVNPALCDILGYCAPDLLARTWQALSHPEDPVRELEWDDSSRAGDRTPALTEKRFVHADGHTVWVLVGITPLYPHDESTPLAFFCQVFDVTRLRLADEERAALETRLHHAQKMEAIGILAGGAAHNFNNLLAIIQNYAAFVIEDLDDDDPKHADVAEIISAAKRASRIVKELVAFSRAEGTDPDPVKLNDVVRQSERLLRGTLGNRIRFRLRLDPSLGTCFINPGQMDQIILNLVLNARQAMPRGGDLTIETANRTIVEADTRTSPGLFPGEYVALTVSDTGTGMTEEIQSRIFEPFFTTKGRASASGLGLASVYGIVKQWRGYIAVDSEPGRGTSMTVYLPATSEAALKPVAARPR